MAKKKKKEDYPIVKYRLVNGNGYGLYENLDNVRNAVKYYRTNPIFKDDERFQAQYVIKVTEEYISIDELGIDGTE